MDGCLPILNPPPRLTVTEWAEQNRYLSREYSAQPGRYSTATVPYAREPMDAANDKDVRLVVLMWASQTTKTTCLENVNAYHITADPSPILLVQPTVEMAQAWSKERFNATVRDTPALAAVLANQRSRDASNTIQTKTFPGGTLAIIGANAPAGLAGRPRRVVLCDEVDRFPVSAGTEGDPVALAIRRTESFHNAVVYLTSTPTIRGASRIEAEYQQTDQRHWFVPCYKCRKEQTLSWKQVRWPEDRPDKAFYQCEHCDTPWTDARRVQALRRGRWKPTAKFNGKRGYFLNGIYSPFKSKRGFKNRLHQMAVEFLEAKAGGPETLKTWTNTFLAETWEEEADRVELAGLVDRAEPYGPEGLPTGVLVVVGAADVQKDRIEYEWIGVGNEEETWGIQAATVYGDTEKPETWKRLTDELNCHFTRSDGVVLRPAVFAIDVHYRPKDARAWARTCRLPFMVLPMIGTSAQSGVLVKSSFTKRHGQRTFSVSTDAAKDILFARLRIESAGPRYCHFPRGYGYTDEWFGQLTAERAVTRYTRGFPRRVYEKTPGVRNEALDIRVYQLAALDVLRPNMEAIASRLTSTAKKRDRRTPVRQPKLRGGWVSGWKG